MRIAGWNGGISGLASCCPELVVALYRSVTHGEAAERARCEALGGFNKDRCLIAAHAARGRALLEAAAPYQDRSSG